MVPPFFDAWLRERRLRRRAVAYVRSLLAEPDAGDVAWLSEAATQGDADRARWELRYARRATGLLSAQRDALDDRTGSAVAHELAESWSRDRNVAASMRHTAEQQFNARLRVLSQALAARTSSEPATARMGRALLLLAGTASAPRADVDRAGSIVARYLDEANESLRQAFGTVALPENVPPSALQSSAREPSDE